MTKYLSLLALHLSGIPSLRTVSRPPSCFHIDNRLYISMVWADHARTMVCLVRARSSLHYTHVYEKARKKTKNALVETTHEPTVLKFFWKYIMPQYYKARLDKFQTDIVIIGYILLLIIVGPRK